MKFELGQKIKISSWFANMGEILAYKHEKFIYNGLPYETSRYYIRISKNHYNWYDETQLESLEPEFDSKFELKLLDELIDVHLASGQYDVVKKLNDEKQKLLGGV